MASPKVEALRAATAALRAQSNSLRSFRTSAAGKALFSGKSGLSGGAAASAIQSKLDSVTKGSGARSSASPAQASSAGS